MSACCNIWTLLVSEFDKITDMLHVFAVCSIVDILVNVEMLQLPEDSVRPPAVGSPVQVRWVDGNLYNAVFKGINNTRSVKVL